MSRIAIIAALERELRPLVHGWNRSALVLGPGTVACFESEDMVAVATGIGPEHATRATRAVIARYQPELLVSAGLAGALVRSLKVGSVFVPNVIIDAATGAEFRSTQFEEITGGGVLVTSDAVAGQTDKQKLVERFHGLVVDMEAASVARVAAENGKQFLSVKAISDEADFVMPPLGSFVGSDGQFQNGRFVRWLAVRPQHWLRVAALSRNGGRAIVALCDWIDNHLSPAHGPLKVVTLGTAELSPVVSKN